MQYSLMCCNLGASRPAYLQGHVITETNGSESDKTVIETVEVAPSFIFGKDSGTGSDDR